MANTNTLFNLFGLFGGIVEKDGVTVVKVVNIYSILNGIILVLAGFIYLTLQYQKAFKEK